MWNLKPARHVKKKIKEMENLRCKNEVKKDSPFISVKTKNQLQLINYE